MFWYPTTLMTLFIFLCKINEYSLFTIFLPMAMAVLCYIALLCCFTVVSALAPMILTPPENLTVVQPEDATFFCEATARPVPTITWWRMEDGVHVQLFNGTDYTIVDGPTRGRIGSSTLTVVRTQPSDALDYFCRTTNVVDGVEATAELIVLGECMRIATGVLV